MVKTARVPPLGSRSATWWLTATAIALAAALALAVYGSATRDAGAANGCPGTIDFAGLPAGEIIDDEYADVGVAITAQANNGGPDTLIVFDSNSSDSRLDSDLRVGIGNIAIFANNLDDNNGDGLVDHPDENNYGGTATFEFDQDVTIASFVFVDKDHGSEDFAYAYDASDNLLAQVPIPQAGDGSVQTINVNADGVRRFVLDYGDSGGFTGIEVTCEQPTPTPTAAAATATPTATPAGEAPTPTASPAPTPTVQGVEESPQATPTATPTAPSAVAAETSGPRPTSAVLGAESLPAGGGSPEGRTDLMYRLATALLAGAAIAAGTFVLTGRVKRQ